jgi:hypothetical protein
MNVGGQTDLYVPMSAQHKLMPGGRPPQLIIGVVRLKSLDICRDPNDPQAARRKPQMNADECRKNETADTRR